MNQIVKSYRPEIDGLRAISVLAILLFHGGFEWASGGFVGVDVFFVISGYLITRNIRHELAAGRFSFAQFYIRRIKRLMPALFFTLLVVLVAGLLLFAPADLERLGRSLQYAIVSLSNFFFWSEAGYFNDASELKPLLHTWSLAVEEQYYLLWPALLVGVSLIKKRGVLVVFLLLLMGLSLLLNYWYLKSNPSAAFFMLPFRAFEFALGALCVSLYPLKFPQRWLSELLTVIGLGMIIAAMLVFDQRTPFPGLAALLPCVGAALIIVAKQSRLGHYGLSNGLMLKLGLASYSIYLIHWPLLVFYKYWKFTPISLSETIGLLLASIVIGLLMWRWVEQPFRTYQQGMNKKNFFIKFFVLVAVFSGLAYMTHKNQGWPQRFPAEYFMSKTEVKENRDRYWSYFAEENKAINHLPNRKHVVVMGNSHAVDLVYALRENDAQLNITFFNSWHQCYHFGTPLAPEVKETCDKRLSRHLKNKAWRNADAVYLHDHWPKLDLKDLKKRLQEIRAITAAPIYVFGPKMSYFKRVPDIILSHMRMASMNEYAKEFSHKPYLSNLNSMVAKMIKKLDVEDLNYIDLLAVQCGAEIDACEIVSPIDGNFLYFDFSHFTLQGAREFGAKLKMAHPELF